MMRRPGSSSSLAISRGGLILLILAALATTSGLAYASPPDPSWIPGIYDDADFDDVVGLATSETSLAGPEGAIALRLVRPRTSPEPPRLESAISRFPTAALHVRAPPALETPHDRSRRSRREPAIVGILSQGKSSLGTMGEFTMDADTALITQEKALLS